MEFIKKNDDVDLRLTNTDLVLEIKTHSTWNLLPAKRFVDKFVNKF